MAYLARVLDQPIPQTEPLREDQVQNSAGGYSWAVDDFTRLQRFLILGSEGGSYYVNERKLTLGNVDAVKRAIASDPERAVRLIVDISDAGRAPRNDPALFALALVASSPDPSVRRMAYAVLPKVARIGTHLFHFAQFVEGMRGWSRGLRSAVARWYSEKDIQALAYQGIKYRQRDGWTHRDLLRLAHPKPPQMGDTGYGPIYHWMTHGWDDIGPEPHPAAGLRQIWAYERAQRTKSAGELVPLIRDYRLPFEAIPSDFLKDTSVWGALLEDMPITAMIRNLATMTRVGLLKPMGEANRIVIDRLKNEELLRRGRVHPIAILAALKTYAAGKGVRGDSTWEPVPQIVSALNEAFYLAFGAVEPSGARTLLSLDVSGSMSSGTVAGVPGLTPREAACAMLLVTARTEPNWHAMAFSTNFVQLNMTPDVRLDHVVSYTAQMPFGGTDCALPMIYAEQFRIPVDSFVIYTDSETWHGNVHPARALQKYRKTMGIPARLTVVGMVSNGFTIANPKDSGMLDVVGFDTATPQLISDFGVGKL